VSVIKRIFDLTFSFLLLILLLPLMAAIALAVKLDSKGPAIYWSKRIGKYHKIFYMPKFRTMFEDTEVVATHLMSDPVSKITKIGFYLRAYSLDEIPQLFSVVKGEMSFVGPRPALFNQYDLIALREENQVDMLRPGITGWAQVNGRDELSIGEKVVFEKEYLQKTSFTFDLYIIWLTLVKVIKKDGVSH